MKTIYLHKDTPDPSAWGYHLTLDCTACDLKVVKNRDTLIEFAKDLCKKIEMKAYGAPLVEHFAGHDAKVAGYSLVQLIETSAITGHFIDKTGDAYLDIFTCAHLNTEMAIQTVQKWLRPAAIHIRFFNRNVPH